MGSSKPGSENTYDIIRHRERIGTAAIGVTLAWLVYMLGLVPWAVGLLDLIESDAWRVATAAGAIGVVIFALTNLGALWRFARPAVRRVINYFTPVMAIDVTAERLKQLYGKLASLDKRVQEVASTRALHELETAKLAREQKEILRQASELDGAGADEVLGRKLNRTEEALERREAMLEEVRANEEMLVDAKEICELCIQRLQASTERYKSTLEVSRTVTDVRSITGDPVDAEESQRIAEDACMKELTEVDLMMLNLETALVDRKLGDRVAALRIAELRQRPEGGSGVRVEAREGDESQRRPEAEVTRDEDRRSKRGKR